MRKGDELNNPNVPLPRWQGEAACRKVESSLFFPPDAEGKRARARREARAKAVCQTCPVMQLCRAHALAADETYGIWGALTEDERLQVSSMVAANARRTALAR